MISHLHTCQFHSWQDMCSFDHYTILQSMCQGRCKHVEWWGFCLQSFFWQNNGVMMVIDITTWMSKNLKVCVWRSFALVSPNHLNFFKINNKRAVTWTQHNDDALGIQASWLPHEFQLQHPNLPTNWLFTECPHAGITGSWLIHKRHASQRVGLVATSPTLHKQWRRSLRTLSKTKRLRTQDNGCMFCPPNNA